MDYRVEFTDQLGRQWDVLINDEKGGSGTKTLQASGNPVTITYGGDVTNKLQIVFPLSADIRVISSNPFELHELLYSSDRRFKVQIFIDGSGTGDKYAFIGWVMPYQSAEPRVEGEQEFIIRCTDGLTDLANHQYLNDGELYDEWQTLSTVIANCLSRTGLTQDFWENIDIYPDNTQTGADSVLDEVYIHTKSYGERVEDVIDCLTVLQRELLPFNARIYQRGFDDDQIGWCIEKTKLKEDGNPTFRRFNSSGVYQDNATKSHEYDIKDDIIIEGKSTTKRSIPPLNNLIIRSARNEANSMLSGANFEDTDFPTASTINNWGAADTNTIASFYSMGVNTPIQSTYQDETCLRMTEYTADHYQTDVTITNNGGFVRLGTGGVHSMATTDEIALHVEGKPHYCCIAEITAVPSTTTLDTNIPYIDDADNVCFYTTNNATILQQPIPLGDELTSIVDSEQIMRLRIRAAVSGPVGGNAYPSHMGVVVEGVEVIGGVTSAKTWRSAMNTGETALRTSKYEKPTILSYYDPKTKRFSNTKSRKRFINNPYKPGFLTGFSNKFEKELLSDSVSWVEDDASNDEIYGITIGGRDFKDNGFQDFSFDIPMNDGFFTSGTPKMYITLMATPNNFTSFNFYISEVDVQLLPIKEDSLESVIDSASQEDQEITLYRYDAPGDDNDEFTYLNPYRILSGSDHVMETTWYEATADVKNLEDHFQDNTEEIYADTSLILEGTAKLTSNTLNRIDLYNTMRDSVDFGRLWHFGRLSHDIRFARIRFTAIEHIPYGDFAPKEPGFDAVGDWDDIFSNWTIGPTSAVYSYATNGATSGVVYFGTGKLDYSGMKFTVTFGRSSTSGFTFQIYSTNDAGSFGSETSIAVPSGNGSTTTNEFTVASRTGGTRRLGFYLSAVQSGDTVSIGSISFNFAGWAN